MFTEAERGWPCNKHANNNYGRPRQWIEDNEDKEVNPRMRV